MTEKGVRSSPVSYGVVVVTRNGGEAIVPTLNSIMDQTLQPTIVCIVDDGSTDDTPQVLRRVSEKFPDRICVVTLPDRGYDIRRVMRNVSLGIREIRRRGIETRYVMISGDDSVYPTNYAEYIVGKMEKNPSLVVASGDFEDVKASSLAPHGSGRFIKNSFLKSLGGRLPWSYGSESWVLEKALQLGYWVECFPEIRYRHLRELGSKHRFRDWGLAMACLGYHPLRVFHRCFKYVHDRLLPPRSLAMLWHYFVPINRKNDPYFMVFEKDLRDYIREKQKRGVIASIRGLLDESARINGTVEMKNRALSNG